MAMQATCISLALAHAWAEPQHRRMDSTAAKPKWVHCNTDMHEGKGNGGESNLLPLISLLLLPPHILQPTGQHLQGKAGGLHASTTPRAVAAPAMHAVALALAHACHQETGSVIRFGREERESERERHLTCPFHKQVQDGKPGKGTSSVLSRDVHCPTLQQMCNPHPKEHAFPISIRTTPLPIRMKLAAQLHHLQGG